MSRFGQFFCTNEKVFPSLLSEGPLVSAFLLARTVLVCNHALKLLSGAATHLSQIVATAEALLLCILLLEVAQLLAIDSASSRLPLVSLNVFAMLCSCSTSHHRTGRLLLGRKLVLCVQKKKTRKGL